MHSLGAQRVEMAQIPLRSHNPPKGKRTRAGSEGDGLKQNPALMGIWLVYERLQTCQKLCMVMLRARETLGGRA